jgi:hypothetical protein
MNNIETAEAAQAPIFNREKTHYFATRTQTTKPQLVTYTSQHPQQLQGSNKTSHSGSNSLTKPPTFFDPKNPTPYVLQFFPKSLPSSSFSSIHFLGTAHAIN